VKRWTKTAALVVGVGNLYRGDDGAGLLIARELKTHLPNYVTIREESGEGASLIEAWRGTPVVVLVDAVQSGGKAGTIHRLNAGRRKIPSRFFHYSTHAFSVAEAVELARTLKQLPPHLVIYGVEGKNFQSGEKLSPEVENAMPEVVLRIREELEAMWRNNLPRKKRLAPANRG
jgi:hydrogenase maturation protease